MMHASHINPDTELKALLDGQITVGMSGGKTEKVTVYSDWERPTNGLPADFIVIYVNGNIEGVGAKVDYASGYLLVSLYSKLNDDGSVKANRVKKILEQFDTEYHLFLQGACCHGGLIYSSEGFNVNTPPSLRVIDPAGKKQLHHTNLLDLGVTTEAEWIDFRGGQCYYCDSPGTIYQVDFEL